jgi:hypothetical protein
MMAHWAGLFAKRLPTSHELSEPAARATLDLNRNESNPIRTRPSVGLSRRAASTAFLSRKELAEASSIGRPVVLKPYRIGTLTEAITGAVKRA